MPEIHPSLLRRKIVHFDMDAFYASVEMRDNPELVGKPVVVGGPPNSRGVVCTASYEARKFGVRSAMACSMAHRLCPQAIFIRPNFEKYRAASIQIREVFKKHTDLIEPLSLDEAYLDVTHNPGGLYATKIAKLIQDEVLAVTGLTGSAGVAPNKLLAKIASDLRKPKGLSVILPAQVEAFMEHLPLRKIHGVGPATEKRLAFHGFKVCKDLWAFSEDELCAKLGQNSGQWLFRMSRGIDERDVCTSRERKSLGREETFPQDILSVDELAKELDVICEDVSESLHKAKLAARTVTIKVKYADFVQSTRSRSLSEFVANKEPIYAIAKQLLLENTEAGRRKVRLIGVSVSNFA